MTDFLLELLSEEIPARMQVKAKADLAKLFTDALTAAGLSASDIETFATPRRLALIAKGLPLETAAVSEETKGPRVGAPPQALDGFLRKTGLTQDQLVERDGVYFAVIDKPGRQTADVLAEAIPAIIRAFPWPKSQRWGAASLSTESLRWVRPLQGIVALLGDDVVPCAIDGITSGRETMGHRFHSSGPVSIANAAGYVDTLRTAHVIVHYSERCAIIRDGAAKAAADAGLVLVEDEGLVSENAGLTEWPVPLLGRFDAAFLAVPEEVIQLTARVNQKYFICREPGFKKLANAFVCTANIDAIDGGAAIIAGNEKVLAARLSDAKFFWEADLKVPLADQAAKLDRIVFHEKLGTVADKVERVAKLARWLVEEGIVMNPPSPSGERDSLRSKQEEGMERQIAPLPGATRLSLSPEGEGLADLAETAARLCKADLVTGSVGEFPELQGVMGGHIARAQGLPDAVADAIRDHYKPVGQGDDVPTAPVTVAVSLADKLDTLISFFAIGEAPTGSRDPFALRRAALGMLTVLNLVQLRLPVSQALDFHLNSFAELLSRPGVSVFERDIDALETAGVPLEAVDLPSLVKTRRSEQLPQSEIDGFVRRAFSVLPFLADRLKVQQREAGVRHDLIDAVFALGGEDDLVRLLARVKALQAFITTDAGANLLSAYKRAANILKSPSPSGERDSLRSKQGEGMERQIAPLRGAARLSLSPEGEGGLDLALQSALDTAEPLAAAAVQAEDFEGAMAALATLRAPIDAFFDGVMVNDPDPKIRAMRSGLLARFRDAVHSVADFSKIEG